MASKKKKNEKKNNDMPREIRILLPTTKIKKSVKCENTAQAYKIFRDILDFEAVELKNDEHFWIMGVDATGTSVYRRYMFLAFMLRLLELRTGNVLTPQIFLAQQFIINQEKFIWLIIVTYGTQTCRSF